MVESLVPLLDVLEENPKHLSWVEPIASRYLDGCVNQPVAGLSEINAWASVAKGGDVKSKVDAARQLMVMEKIKEVILDAAIKIDDLFEVEASNVLLYKVHDTLVREGMKKWPGVQRDIKWQSNIKSWIKGNVEHAREKGRYVMKKPLSEVGDFLLSDANIQTWATIAFPEDKAAIEKQYETQREALEELFLAPEKPYEKAKGEKLSIDVEAQIETYEAQLADLLPKDRVTQLIVFSKEIDVGCKVEIGNTIRALTQSAIPSEKFSERLARKRKAEEAGTESKIRRY